jgi:hypothetical protein
MRRRFAPGPSSVSCPKRRRRRLVIHMPSCMQAWPASVDSLLTDLEGHVHRDALLCTGPQLGILRNVKLRVQTRGALPLGAWLGHSCSMRH